MDRFVENNTRMVKSTNAPDNGEKRRTALKDIHNVTIHGDPPFPYVINKGPGPDENSFDENSQKFAGHRPITRKFAASMANRSPISQRSNQRDEEIGINRHNKASSLESSLNDFKGTLVQECTKTMEHPLLPMSEEIEEMVDVDLCEDCDLKEAEMEDLVVEPVLNIDSLDFHNPLALADYVEDIYSFYRKAESSGCVHPDYMLNQVDVNEKMRAILIDWLIEVHYKFDLMDETLFLTVNLVDRFLSQQTVVRKKLQLVGVTALLIACKYEEIVVPVVEDLVLISDRAYTRQEVLDMEKLMINTLQFNLSFPTPYVFMKRFLKAAQSDKKLELLSFFMIELCLVEYEMLKFHPSLLAASAIYTAQCTLKGYKSWSKTSEFYTTYTEDQLSECSKLMVGFHEKAGKGKLTGVLKKYSTSKFGYAAKSQPAHFLMS